MQPTTERDATFKTVPSGIYCDEAQVEMYSLIFLYDFLTRSYLGLLDSSTTAVHIFISMAIILSGMIQAR